MTVTPDDIQRAVTVMEDEGLLPGSGLHSWRCEDKDRYPEPCTCVAELAEAVLAAVLPEHDKRLLDRFAARTIQAFGSDVEAAAAVTRSLLAFPDIAVVIVPDLPTERAVAPAAEPTETP